MNPKRLLLVLPMIAWLSIFSVAPLLAAVLVQCPGDSDGDAIPDPANPNYDPNVACMHLSAGDGYAKMADGSDTYIFGFKDVTGTPSNQVISSSLLNMESPAPTIKVKEGKKFYLTLTNVGMKIRFDLFDPHSVHWHGFPQATSVFDGVPDSSISINMLSSLTYFFNVVEPGTFMYHCHVEAVEHMQMGMNGNLYVTPAQDDLPDGTDLNGFTHHTGYLYAYNDGDGSTYYDVDYPVQLGGFDSAFHEANETFAPLPFATMKDDYPLINGRGYPDTIDEAPIVNKDGNPSQKINSLIKAQVGEKILLRVSNLNITEFFTVRALGMPMKVVGLDSRLLRGSTGENLYYTTNSLSLGGGQSADVILDTTGMSAGKYYLYTTNLHLLSNGAEDFGGMMTEIHLN